MVFPQLITSQSCNNCVVLPTKKKKVKRKELSPFIYCNYLVRFANLILLFFVFFQGFPSKRFGYCDEKTSNPATHQQHYRLVSFNFHSVNCFFSMFTHVCNISVHQKNDERRDLFRFVDSVSGLFAMYWVEKSTTGSNRER